MQSTLYHCIESVTAGSMLYQCRRTIIMWAPKVSWLNVK